MAETVDNTKIDSDASIRIDKWLWATRFYKTRSLAVSAIENGRILIAEQRVKPSRLIKIGDAITINQNGLIYNIIVLGLLDKRQSAKIAIQMYSESEQSIAERKKMQENLTIASKSCVNPQQKPNKKSRRDLISLKHLS